MAEQTPREEFEEQFGQITDDKWQWLKEFFDRNRTDEVVDWTRVAGFKVDGRIWAKDAVEVILRDTVREITKAEIISISVDPRPNAFGYGIDHAKLFIDPEMRRTDG